MVFRFAQCALVLISLSVVVVALHDDIEIAGEDDMFAGSDATFQSGRAGQGRVFQLEHCLGLDGVFEPRGSIEVVISSLTRQASVKFVENSVWDQKSIDKLQGLADSGSFYQVRVRSNLDDPAAPYVMGSTPAEDIVAASRLDYLGVHVDHDGNVMALDYRARLSPSRRSKKTTTTTLEAFAATEARSIPVGAVSAPVGGPDGNALPAVGADGMPEAPAPVEQSFLRKYWYIILPMVLMMLMGGEPPAEGGAAAGASGSAAAGAPAAAGGGVKR